MLGTLLELIRRYEGACGCDVQVVLLPKHDRNDKLLYPKEFLGYIILADAVLHSEDEFVRLQVRCHTFVVTSLSIAFPKRVNGDVPKNEWVLQRFRTARDVPCDTA